ncbi:nitronate monooxygenase [Halieaceae bacterium IMCC14734]|uniref:Propionate 3-nitronate monooxygenase n=1 Tax=Candidatus Litorirhabdus singularis TaxID=2518993 RepID=A0ABT3TGF5_9GAMM|nr:nitronate monooxygenase [Candidatus Litorirhabdus singularis]MCX2981109.1 nitronate monooxygenase [Candidatus Litorirhabdus singularis]
MDDFLPKSLAQTLGIVHPLLQAPMAGASNPDLVAAVSNAGGLGGLGAAGMSPEQLSVTVRDIHERTDAPFNVNLFHQSTEAYDTAALPDRLLAQQLQDYHDEYGLGAVPEPVPLFGPAAEQLQVLLEAGVPVISFHFGVDTATVATIHAAGAKVLCTATTLAEALQLQAAGVDAVIAQGSEAGGHRGTFDGDYQAGLIGSMALVPRLVDALEVPVIAAGGIMDARGMVASFALGAAAVQMGTAFLGCPETALAQPWDAALNAAEADDTCVTSTLSGKPARGIRNRYINDLERADTPLLPYPAQYAVSRVLRQSTVRAGSADFMAMWAGQGVGLYSNLPAAERVEQLIDEANTLIRQLSEPRGR